MKSRLTALVILCCATGVFAHTGVQNPAVQARMDGMKAIADNLKVIGLMARGDAAFDAATARSAAAVIAQHAGEVETHFAAQEDDPKSEARPTIWEDFDDFIAIAAEMEVTARSLTQTIETQEDTVAALTSLGQTCRSCHTAYRE